MNQRRYGIVLLITGALLLALPGALGCFTMSVTCDDPEKEVEPGKFVKYEIKITYSPGCRSTYWMSFSKTAPPAGWTAEIQNSNGQNIEGSEVFTYSGSGTSYVYLRVDAPIWAQNNEKAVITVTIEADDHYNQHSKYDITTVTTVKIIDPPPMVVGGGIAGFSIKEDTVDRSIKLAEHFQDGDGDQLYFAAKQSTHFRVSIALDSTVTLTPEENWNGEETLTFTATDGYTEVPTSVTVTVTAEPDPPFVAHPMRDFGIMENSEDSTSVRLSKVFFDPDLPYGDRLSFGFSGNDRINVTIRADASVVLKPEEGWSGKETITFEAKDLAGAGVTDEVVITVTDANRPPEVLTPPTKKIDEDSEDTSLDLTTIFKDPDPQDSLSFEVTRWCFTNTTVDAAGMVTMRPLPEWSGQDTLEFSASDGLFTAYTSVLVTVAPVNDRPFVKKEIELAMDEDCDPVSINLAHYFGDVDSLDLTYKATGKHFTITQNGPTVELKPELNWFGTETLKFSCSDIEYTVTQTVDVVVRAVDDPPLIIDYLPRAASLTIAQPGKMTFSVSAMDIDSSRLYYRWQVDDNISFFVDTGKEATAEVPLDSSKLSPGLHKVTAIVSADGGEASQSWMVSVILGNQPPTASIVYPLADGKYTTDREIQFKAHAEDPDGDALTYEWFVDGAKIYDRAEFSAKLAKGTHHIKLVVSDTSSHEVTKELDITVEAKPAQGSATPGFELLIAALALGALLLVRRKR